MLNGVVYGYKTAIINLTATTTELELKDGSTFLVVTKTSGDKFITMPKLTQLQRVLGLPSTFAETTSIPFSIEINVVYYGAVNEDINLVFRGYTGYTSNQYPYLHYEDDNIHQGDSQSSITMSRGDAVKLLLVYYPLKVASSGELAPYQAIKLVHSHT